MSLGDVLDAALDEAVRCIGDTSCEYIHAITLGPPPEECNTLAAFYNRTAAKRRITGCSQTLTTTITLQLTRCCNFDAIQDFDWESEVREAACWNRDFWQLLACLSCTISTVLEQWVTSCDDVEIYAEAPHEREGGCFSGYIHITYPTSPCCDDFTP